MDLAARLRTLADLVPQGTRFADVGTDHAYLPVWLILCGHIPGAIAADLRPGPLERARETARQYRVEDRICFRLCDGLSGIGQEEVDTIAIAGMGGDTISAILAAAPWSRDKRLLLQPMTAFPSLRSWLGKAGYKIEEERIAAEGERLYSIWVVTGGEMGPMSPAELWVGRQSREDPLRLSYLGKMRAKVRRALDGQLASRHWDETQIGLLREVLRGIGEMEKELRAE